MINIYNKKEIDLIKKSGYINYLTHEELKKNIKVGISTNELNDIAHSFILKNKCIPSFLNYDGFPKSICTSINEEVVHGIPSNRKLKEGDIISIDIGVNYKGYHSDSARTYIIGQNKKYEKLLKDTKRSLDEAINKLKEGVPINIIGNTINKIADESNLSVVIELVGHGVGKNLHEEPNIPNFKNDDKTILKEGMVLAIEPMLNYGKRDILMLDDDWTIITKDNKPSAHFEHTVVITKEGSKVLTGG